MERYCDIVMKGGITSGVVYPLAAVELAKEHRFRNIGGTSAGAIAAAAVAAAEVGTRGGGNPDAYRRLERLPDWLGANLTSLFQPSRRMRPLFNALLAGLGKGIPRKVAAPLRGFPLAASAGALAGTAFILAALLLDAGSAMRIVACAIGVVIVLPACVLLAIVASAASRLYGLRHGNFGLCPGNDRNGDAASPPLTRWLAEFLDELAGKGAEDRPLTFGDLEKLKEPDGEPGLRLQMMTSSLSMGRPYTLPFEDSEKLWFEPDEFRGLFPEWVVDHMVDTASVDPDGPPREGLVRFPQAADLPVVVAARMSLSFPLLIAAVPLYAENYSWKEGPQVDRCWFSDGGITSNFPVHFFDSPVPRWPTFAIDLIPLTLDRKLADDESQNVWLPSDNDDGVGEAWVGWEDKGGFAQIGAFLRLDLPHRAELDRQPPDARPWLSRPDRPRSPGEGRGRNEPEDEGAGDQTPRQTWRQRRCPVERPLRPSTARRHETGLGQPALAALPRLHDRDRAAGRRSAEGLRRGAGAAARAAPRGTAARRRGALRLEGHAPGDVRQRRDHRPAAAARRLEGQRRALRGRLAQAAGAALADPAGLAGPAQASIQVPFGPRLRTGVSPIRLSQPQDSWMWPQTASRGRFSSIAREQRRAAEVVAAAVGVAVALRRRVEDEDRALGAGGEHLRPRPRRRGRSSSPRA